jgi:hypothetical protein
LFLWHIRVRLLESTDLSAMDVVFWDVKTVTDIPEEPAASILRVED